MPVRARVRRSTFDRVYSAVVACKGLDGAVEFVAGLLLLVAPRLTGRALVALATELAEGTSPLRAAAAHSIAVAAGGPVTGAAALALLLLGHGAVKLLAVSVLVRRVLRWYPWTLLTLVALFLAQLVGAVGTPTIGGWALMLLDVVVIVLVACDYERLRRDRSASSETAAAHAGDRARAL